MEVLMNLRAGNNGLLNLSGGRFVYSFYHYKDNGIVLPTEPLNVPSWNGKSTRYINIDNYYYYGFKKTVKETKDSQWTLCFWYYQKQQLAERHNDFIGIGLSDIYHRIMQSFSYSGYASTFGIWTINNVDSMKANNKTPLNKWIHIAVVFDKGKIMLFLDGIKHQERTVPEEYFYEYNTIGFTGWYPYITFYDDILFVWGKAFFTENYTPPTDYLVTQKRLFLKKNEVYSVR